MSGFWRKILDKKASNTHTPQPGDWAAMQSMLDKSPVLGKPAAGGNGAAGSSSIFGGSTIIKGIVAVVVSLSAYTTYVVLNEDESSAEDSYYYQARIESENTAEEMPVSLQDQDQESASEITTQRPSETADLVELPAIADLSKQHSNAAVASFENKLEAVSAAPVRADRIASDEMKADRKIQEEGTAADQPSQVKHPSDPENSDAEPALADYDPTSRTQGSETLANSDATGSQPIYDTGANSMASDNPDPEAGQKYSGTPNEQDGITSEEPPLAKDSEEALSVNMTDDDGASPDKVYEEEEEEEEDESDVIVDALKRMEFNSVAAGAQYQSQIGLEKYYALGTGVELEWRLSGWRFQTGLNYQQWFETSGSELKQIVHVDTNIRVSVETSQRTWVDSAWVIIGLNQGEYRYDTLSATFTDTIYNTSLDSIIINKEHLVPTAQVSSRFSIPIRLAYRKRIGSFYGDLGAALISNFTTYESLYADDAQKSSYSLDLALRPAVGYQIGKRWSAEIGFSYLMPIYAGIPDQRLFNQDHQWSMGFGIRYFLN